MIGIFAKSLIIIVTLYLPVEVRALDYCRAIHICKNQECIPSDWRCDQEKDCNDGTDEDGCIFKRKDCYKSIGLDDKNRFKDDQFHAFSSKISAKYGYYTPNNARISTKRGPNSAGGWCADPVSPYDGFVEIDLKRPYYINKIGTKGLNGGNTWVKSYEMRYRYKGKMKRYLSVDGTHAKEFTANTDTDSLVINKLESGIYADHLTIVPKTSKFETCMRFELYGCVFDDKNIKQ